MAIKKERRKEASVVSLRHLAIKSNVSYMKLFNNLNGTYNSLTPQEKMDLVNTFYNEVTPFLLKLGVYMTLNRVKGQAPTEAPPEKTLP